MNTQKKFEEAVDQIAYFKNLEVVNDREWANRGHISVQRKHSFASLLDFDYDFQDDYFILTNIAPPISPLDYEGYSKYSWWRKDGGTPDDMVDAIRQHLNEL